MPKKEKKVVLITGGSSGIGEAAAERLAASGWRVAIVGRSEDELAEVQSRLEKKQQECLTFIADVQDDRAMGRVFEEVLQHWDRLDSVFANAGINGVWADLDQLELEDWDETLSINLRGTFLTIKLAYPHLRKQGGTVVVTSSVNGTRMFSNQGATAYAVSKAGQVALVKMLAVELARQKIRINAICPGRIDTEINDNTERKTEKPMEVKFPDGNIPLTGERAGTAEQVAELVHFLTSDASSHITGSVIFIDGGQSLLQG
ncbi:MAG: SDR family NAD(P)-dependent oxidoreductase [Vulcanimicrobiota bacterium]